MLMTLPAAALVAVICGAAIIAKAALSTTDNTLVARGSDSTRIHSPLFAVLDEQRIETHLGLALIVFGAVLLLVYSAGLVLQLPALAILGSLVLIFLVAHSGYARHLRATQPERFAALLVRIVAAQGGENALTGRPDHATLPV